MKAVVAAFNQEKALVGAFSVIRNLWMDLFEALEYRRLLGGTFCMNFVTLQKLYTEYELQGMEEERLNTHFYQQVTQRMATEEATCVLSNAEQAENG